MKARVVDVRIPAGGRAGVTLAVRDKWKRWNYKLVSVPVPESPWTREELVKYLKEQVDKLEESLVLFAALNELVDEEIEL